ncbi:MAG: hypothetical protein BWY40_00912 [bacterium ADurb.Bin270]|nr:MAG: hypothetical protein BWY40_00912 [bacterium ADurb.Bin270]
MLDPGNHTNPFIPQQISYNNTSNPTQTTMYLKTED